ncbi:MAG: GNAT family N-acetyltransferase, partial [Ktedonobacteraceae bacterium]
MDTITLRPLDPQSDFPRVAELLSAVQPEPVTATALEDRYRHVLAGRIQQDIVACDEQGHLVGFNHIWRNPWQVAGKFGIEVVVDSAARRQGIGAQLYANALAFVQPHGATLLEGEIRDDVPEALRFVQARGFEIDRHQFEYTLDLASFDEKRFAGVIEGVETSGIRFTNLAELGDTLEAQRQLYELNRSTGLDIPGHEQTYKPFEQFQQDVFMAAWYRADGQIVALDGEQWIGMAAIGYFSTNNSVYNMMTGVV